MRITLDQIPPQKRLARNHMFHVYVLMSGMIRHRYVWFSENLDDRFRRHNAGESNHDTELHGFCFTRRDSQSEAKQWHGTGIRKRERVAMNSVGSMRPSWDGNINFLDAPDWSA